MKRLDKIQLLSLDASQGFKYSVHNKRNTKFSVGEILTVVYIMNDEKTFIAARDNITTAQIAAKLYTCAELKVDVPCYSMYFEVDTEDVKVDSLDENSLLRKFLEYGL